MMQIIAAPCVTEKATGLSAEHNQYVFKVLLDATKPEVKAAVEHMLGAKVTGVNLLNIKGKTKRFRHTQGRRKDWKKAYVSLAEGSAINHEGMQ